MLNDEPDYKRLFIAVLAAALLLIGWQMKVEWPRRQALAHYTAEQSKLRAQEQTKYAQTLPAKETDAEDNPSLTRAQRLAASPRIAINSDKLHGSIALEGARFDDIELAKYHETPDPASPEVTLFSPNGEAEAYFAQVSWLASDKTKVPDQHSLWQADKTSLPAGGTVNLRWDNGEGVTFILAVSLDDNYMFSITQRVENHSGHDIAVMPYAYINRAYEEPQKADYGGLHKGPLGVMDGALEEIPYKELRDKGNKTYENASDWFGITDKYWLSALIPDDHYKATFSYYNKNGRNRYQVDYLSPAEAVATGGSADYHVRLFAGAKELKLLDHYTAGDAAQHQPPIPLFDRAIDFGVFYFLTKPMSLLLNFLYVHTGNFSIAILLLTILVRLALYPVANKSFKTSAQMRRLQPEVAKIRERYFDDQITMNKEMMALYKRQKINPAAGCLPVLPQMLVFIALFKVLNVSIEMFHTPLFGWIKDLSATDPSNLFTAFGLVPWNTPAWLHLGILPIIYCGTMIVQMRQQPTPPDPTTAKTMKFMPYFMLLFFNNMPAGLVFYFIWSNLISILQQQIISRRHGGNAVPATKGAA